MAVRILIADDHKILREGLCSLLQKQTDMEVVGEAGDGETAIRLAHELKPDVIVMDINMAAIDGINATRQIKNDLPDTKIVVLSMYAKKSFVEEMLKAGASAYVLKEHAFSELTRAINSVIADQMYLCSKATSIIVDSYIQHDSETAETSKTKLTDREREILKLLTDGKNTKQIALKLHISTKTVDTHRRNIMDKLDLYSLPELTKYAIRCGLASVE